MSIAVDRMICNLKKSTGEARVHLEHVVRRGRGEQLRGRAARVQPLQVALAELEEELVRGGDAVAGLAHAVARLDGEAREAAHLSRSSRKEMKN